MSKLNRSMILREVVPLFAQSGSKHVSIRTLAKKLGVAPSVIYYHYENEEALLLDMFLELNHELGRERAKLPATENVSEMLKQRITFQIDHQESIIAVLKYYLSFRNRFPQREDGFIPDKSTLHILEVLTFGEESGAFTLENKEDDAKVIAHAINGFLLEYYPYTLTGNEKKKLIQRIHSFLMRALLSEKKL